MAIQIFGTKKCQTTRKAERFFKERAVPYHFVDLQEKGISKGELESIARAVGPDKLIDKTSKLYKDRGFEYMDYDALEEILAQPMLLKTPVVRKAAKAVIGDEPKAWLDLVSGS